MSVETKHPEFDAVRSNDWKLVRDAADGQSQVKSRGTMYLPKPDGFTAMSDKGEAMYSAYKARARFPEIFKPTLSGMVGVIHDKGIEIEMPDSLSYLREAATQTGLSLEAFHRRITSSLLKMGRYAVLADAPEDGGEPFLAGYAGDTVINWDDSGAFFVIDDSGKVRDGFQWVEEKRYVELTLEDDKYIQRVHTDGVTEDVSPTASGEQSMDRIPFVVANSDDISPDLITPPLIGVAQAAIAIYQLSADYRHQLFMSGQETLVAINGEAPTQIGAGVVHQMDGTETQTPDLKYVSPTCSGIEAHERAKEDEKEAAVRAGARLLEQDNGTEESGRARQLRMTSNNSVLANIARVSCELLEQSLRNIAMMKGLDQGQQEQVVVTPPKELGDTTMSPQDALALVQAWQARGFSQRTLYENLQRGGIANPERTFEDELLEPDGFEGDEQEQLEAVA